MNNQIKMGCGFIYTLFKNLYFIIYIVSVSPILFLDLGDNTPRKESKDISHVAGKLLECRLMDHHEQIRDEGERCTRKEKKSLGVNVMELYELRIIKCNLWSMNYEGFSIYLYV